MSAAPLRGVIVSDFNAANFAGCLKNTEDLPEVEATPAPFGQVIPALLQANHPFWRDAQDFAVVWTQPQGVIRSFEQALKYQAIREERLLAEVDEYGSLLAGASGRTRSLFVPTWVIPATLREFGLLDLKPGVGLSHTLMRMNLRLAERCEKVSNIHLLNAQRWMELAGKRAWNPKLWYMGKIPFGNDVFIEAAREIKAGLRGLTGQSRKLILLDLDETLWGGVVGDVGWENLTLGGHDPVGEAFADFQRALKALTNRGILLGIVSKNEETVALEAIERHPEMVLRREDFVGWRINWRDKAENVVDLVKSTNLGLQSVVFIDDSPVERARVRETLPEVFVPEWPHDKLLCVSALQELLCFNPSAITEEDRERTRLYASEGQREELKRQVASLDEWLRTLGVTVRVEGLKEANLQRTAQLLNKTNQMNLTTRRMAEADLIKWVQEPEHRLWTFRVSDKFGDSGLTGIAGLEIGGRTGTIVDFVLSCRVMGRKVEETMLWIVTDYARSRGLDRVQARYIPTSKNKPCLEFWQASGFAQETQDERVTLFSWNLHDPYHRPDSVTVEGDLA